MPVDYANGQIYKISSQSHPELVYYGSSCQRLSQRLHQHKISYQLFLNKKFRYTTSFEIVKLDDCYISPVESYPCSNKTELHSRERWYIQNNNCVNKVVPTRTHKEYRENNREALAEKTKEYYENNRETIAEKKKEYYENNRDTVLEKQKKYNENNKDKLTQQISCECGGRYQFQKKARHEQSKRHQNFLIDASQSLT